MSTFLRLTVKTVAVPNSATLDIEWQDRTCSLARYTVQDPNLAISGSFSVVLGICNPSALEMLPKDEDLVRVTVLIYVLKSAAPRDVRIQATWV